MWCRIMRDAGSGCFILYMHGSDYSIFHLVSFRNKIYYGLLAKSSSVLDSHLRSQGHFQNVSRFDGFQVAFARKGSFALEIESFQFYRRAAEKDARVNTV